MTGTISAGRPLFHQHPDPKFANEPPPGYPNMTFHFYLDLTV